MTDLPPPNPTASHPWNIYPHTNHATGETVWRHQGATPMPASESYMHAFNLLCAAMNEAATDNDLCSTYDEFVEETNRHMPMGIEIPTRARNYDVSFRCKVPEDYIGQLEGQIDDILRDAASTESEDFEYSQA